MQVLSDPEKKRQYDLYGPMESQPSRPNRGRHGFYEHDPTHGFESDMTAEEIFNMFFGGGFPSQSVYVRRGRTSAHFQRHYHTHGGNGNTEGHHHTVREVPKYRISLINNRSQIVTTPTMLTFYFYINFKLKFYQKPLFLLP